MFLSGLKALGIEVQYAINLNKMLYGIKRLYIAYMNIAFNLIVAK